MSTALAMEERMSPITHVRDQIEFLAANWGISSELLFQAIDRTAPNMNLDAITEHAYRAQGGTPAAVRHGVTSEAHQVYVITTGTNVYLVKLLKYERKNGGYDTWVYASVLPSRTPNNVKPFSPKRRRR